ncbi:hypothetical protein [Halomonas sp. KRD171]|uniref:hypothetical protein n=1 Tax=Halomonas sp. KRD171 TaxID=2729726 RepID=UPI0019D06C5C|nr:hypothetical protein [Halomonas sp. KRD171]
MGTIRQHGWRYALWLIAFSVPLIWWALPDSIASKLFIPAWIVVAQFIFAGLVEKAYLRRQTWLGQYLKVNSPWHQRLRAGVLIIAWNQLVGFILAPLLLVSLRRLTGADWPILLLASGTFVLCHYWLNNQLQGHVIDNYLPAVTRQLTVLPVAGLLTLVLALVPLWRDQPYMINIPWETAIREHLPAISGQSMLAGFERISASYKLSGFWLMQNASNNFGMSSKVTVLGWGVLLLVQGTLAWPYIRLLTGVATVQGFILTDSQHKRALSKSAEDRYKT